MKKRTKKIPPENEEEVLSSDELRARRKAERKRRILRNRLVFLGILLLIVGAIVFRVCVVAKTINVTNETPYPDEQLLAAMDEGKGTFLFSFSADKIAEKLKTVYPYVGSVEVKKHFPTTVDITFRCAEKSYAFMSDGYYVFTDSSLRVLEISKTPDNAVLTVIGADIGEYEKGKQIDSSTFIYGDFIANIQAQAEWTGVGNITKVDISKKYRIAFLLNDTVTVVLGDFSDIDRKFDTLKYIVGENDMSVVATINVKDFSRGKYSLGSDIFSAEPITQEPTTAPEQNDPDTTKPSSSSEQGTSSSYDSDIEP